MAEPKLDGRWFVVILLVVLLTAIMGFWQFFRGLDFIMGAR